MKKLLSLCIILLITVSSLSAADDFVVVIDPGHGGKDAGAVRNSAKEKDINLAVALQLGRLIEGNMSGVKVIYTRKSDVFVDLYKRADIANKAKANLFISIHTNSTASKTTTAAGADTYILGLHKSAENLDVAKRENSVILLEDNYSKKYEDFDPNSPESYIIFEFMVNKYMQQSLEFARSLQKDFKAVAKRNDRGVRQAGFLVLKQTSMPSVLIELGFINNPTEVKYLTSTSGQRALASSIYSAFRAYKEDFDKRQGGSITVKETSPAPSVVKQDPAPTPNRNETVAVNNARTPETVKPVVKNKVQSIIKEQNTKGQKQAKASQEQKASNVKISPQVTAAEPTPQIASGEIEYRVQFLWSKDELSTNSAKFKGLSPVSYYKENGTYKYTYGSAKTMNQAINLQRDVRKKFPDAFVVKFKDGKRF